MWNNKSENDVFSTKRQFSFQNNNPSYPNEPIFEYRTNVLINRYKNPLFMALTCSMTNPWVFGFFQTNFENLWSRVNRFFVDFCAESKTHETDHFFLISWIRMKEDTFETRHANSKRVEIFWSRYCTVRTDRVANFFAHGSSLKLEMGTMFQNFKDNYEADLTTLNYLILNEDEYGIDKMGFLIIRADAPRVLGLAKNKVDTPRAAAGLRIVASALTELYQGRKKGVETVSDSRVSSFNAIVGEFAAEQQHLRLEPRLEETERTELVRFTDVIKRSLVETYKLGHVDTRRTFCFADFIRAIVNNLGLEKKNKQKRLQDLDLDLFSERDQTDKNKKKINSENKKIPKFLKRKMPARSSNRKIEQNYAKRRERLISGMNLRERPIVINNSNLRNENQRRQNNIEAVLRGDAGVVRTQRGYYVNEGFVSIADVERARNSRSSVITQVRTRGRPRKHHPEDESGRGVDANEVLLLAAYIEREFMQENLSLTEVRKKVKAMPRDQKNKLKEHFGNVFAGLVSRKGKPKLCKFTIPLPASLDDFDDCLLSFDSKEHNDCFFLNIEAWMFSGFKLSVDQLRENYRARLEQASCAFPKHFDGLSCQQILALLELFSEADFFEEDFKLRVWCFVDAQQRLVSWRCDFGSAVLSKLLDVDTNSKSNLKYVGKHNNFAASRKSVEALVAWSHRRAPKNTQFDSRIACTLSDGAGSGPLRVEFLGRFYNVSQDVVRELHNIVTNVFTSARQRLRARAIGFKSRQVDMFLFGGHYYLIVNISKFFERCQTLLEIRTTLPHPRCLRFYCEFCLNVSFDTQRSLYNHYGKCVVFKNKYLYRLRSEKRRRVKKPTQVQEQVQVQVQANPGMVLEIGEPDRNIEMEIENESENTQARKEKEKNLETIKFRNHTKQLQSWFTIYADIESILVKRPLESENDFFTTSTTTTSKSTKKNQVLVDDHVPVALGMLLSVNIKPNCALYYDFCYERARDEQLNNGSMPPGLEYSNLENLRLQDPNLEDPETRDMGQPQPKPQLQPEPQLTRERCSFSSWGGVNLKNHVLEDFFTQLEKSAASINQFCREMSSGSNCSTLALLKSDNPNIFAELFGEREEADIECHCCEGSPSFALESLRLTLSKTQFAKKEIEDHVAGFDENTGGNNNKEHDLTTTTTTEKQILLAMPFACVSDSDLVWGSHNTHTPSPKRSEAHPLIAEKNTKYITVIDSDSCAVVCTACYYKVLRQRKTVAVYFHNLRGYDGHLLIDPLFRRYKAAVRPISITTQKYICFNVEIQGVTFSFRDSLSFIVGSLGSAIAKVDRSKLKFFSNDEYGACQKQLFPYEWFDRFSKLTYKSFPDASCFGNKLGNFDVHCEEFPKREGGYPIDSPAFLKHHGLAAKFFVDQGFNCFEQYMRFYLRSDVLMLAELMDAFSIKGYEAYGLWPDHYITAPSYSWDAALKFTNVALEILEDRRLVDFFLEFGTVRGGVSQKGLVNDLDLDKEPYFKHIFNFDVNNLYGFAMKALLPVGGFSLHNKFDDFDGVETTWHAFCLEQLRLDPEGETGLIFEVSISCTKEARTKMMNLPMLPEHKFGKLITSLDPKFGYKILHSHLLLAMRMGYVVNKFHTVVRFRQTAWLAAYIEKNTKMRTLARTPGERDFYKLMNNSVYGKTMENIFKRKKYEFCAVNDYKRIFELLRLKFTNIIPVSDDILIFENNTHVPVFDKAVYVGFAILEHSKVRMYSLLFEIQKAHPQSVLLYTDTDSLIMAFDENFSFDGLEHLFDLSVYPRESEWHRNVETALGLLKDEFPCNPIRQFYAVKSKLYIIRMSDGSLKVASKGIPKKVFYNFSLDRFKCDTEEALASGQAKKYDWYRIISKKHRLSTSHERKIVFSNLADTKKQHFVDMPGFSFPFGITSEEEVEMRVLFATIKGNHRNIVVDVDTDLDLGMCTDTGTGKDETKNTQIIKFEKDQTFCNKVNKNKNKNLDFKRTIKNSHTSININLDLNPMDEQRDVWPNIENELELELELEYPSIFEKNRKKPNSSRDETQLEMSNKNK